MKDSGLQRNFVAHDFEPSWRCYTLYLLYFAIFAHAQTHLPKEIMEMQIKVQLLFFSHKKLIIC